MTTSAAMGIIVFLVCLVLTASVILLIKAQELHQRSLDVMMCVYDWLEQEVKTHECTD